jgi:hypothetical protein
MERECREMPSGPLARITSNEEFAIYPHVTMASVVLPRPIAMLRSDSFLSKGKENSRKEKQERGALLGWR